MSSFRTQTTCECQRAIGPAGVGPRMPRRTLNIAPTRVGARPGARRVDQRLGTDRVEHAAVGAEAAVLGVEPADRDVARCALREVGVEALRFAARTSRQRVVTTRSRASSRSASRRSPASASERSGYWARCAASPWLAPAARVGCPGGSVHSTRGAYEGGWRGPAKASAATSAVNANAGESGGASCSTASDGDGSRAGPLEYRRRGCSSMVELQPSKLAMRVRFPPPASFLPAPRGW